MNFITSQVTEAPQDVNTPEVTENTATLPGSGDAEKLLQGDDLLITAAPDGPTARELWQARITAPKDEKRERRASMLRRIIDKIRAVEFRAKALPVKPFIEVEPPAAAEPNEPQSAEEASAESQEKEIKSKTQVLLPYQPPSARTLQMVDNVSQQPAQIAKPFELAEVLFRSGHLAQASVLYRQALERIDCNEAGSAGDRAWILFQTANCLRENEPQKAMKMYSRLITEYPDSVWTELAKSRLKLIEWSRKEEPRKLIAEGQIELANGVFTK